MKVTLRLKCDGYRDKRMEFYTSILRCASGDGEQIVATKIVTRDSIGIIKNNMLVSVKKVLRKIAILISQKWRQFF